MQKRVMISKIRLESSGNHTLRSFGQPHSVPLAKASQIPERDKYWIPQIKMCWVTHAKQYGALAKESMGSSRMISDVVIPNLLSSTKLHGLETLLETKTTFQFPHTQESNQNHTNQSNTHEFSIGNL